MAALIVTGGKQRILQLIVNDCTHIGFGRPDPAWSNELIPPAESASATGLVSAIGYAKVQTRGWMEQNPSGSIFIDGQYYQVSGTPTNIAYISGIIPSGEAEGVPNRIGQIGIFSQAVTSPTNANWVNAPGGITTAGTLLRIQHIPAHVKVANSQTEWIVLFPLLS